MGGGASWEEVRSWGRGLEGRLGPAPSPFHEVNAPLWLSVLLSCLDAITGPAQQDQQAVP